MIDFAPKKRKKIWKQSVFGELIEFFAAHRHQEILIYVLLYDSYSPVHFDSLVSYSEMVLCTLKISCHMTYDLILEDCVDCNNARTCVLL